MHGAPADRRSPSAHAAQAGVTGTMQVFAAELLIVPSGILVAALLTRTLGPADFALFALAATAIAWIEWTVTTMFSRASLKLVAEAGDWKPIGGLVLRAHLTGGLLAMVLIWIAAIPVARALDAPGLATVLALFALDVPLFTAAQAHRAVLVGRGLYRERAVSTAARWISRLAFVALFVAIDRSVAAAIAGSIAATVTELLVARRFIRLSPFARSSVDMRNLLEFAAPLLIFAVCARLVDKIDLFALRGLGESLATTGAYSAAQNLSLGPGLFAAALSPVLITTMTRRLRIGDTAAALQAARNSLRASFLLLPFAAVVAGAAPEITTLLFGREFIAAAQPLAVLMVGASALVVLAIATAILVAIGQVRSLISLGAAMVIAAVAGHVVLIPSFGALGASAVTTATSFGAAAIAVGLAHRVSGVAVPLTTLLRSSAVAVAAYAAASVWATSGPIVIAQLAVLAAGVAAALVVLHEFNPREIASLRSAVVSLGRLRPEGAI